MKAWLGLHIISDNPAILNAIENMLPHLSDDRLWSSEEHQISKGTIDGQNFIAASLFFNDFNERTSFKSALAGINGFIHAADIGSYIKGSKSYRDELLPNGTTKFVDELEFEEVVV